MLRNWKHKYRNVWKKIKYDTLKFKAWFNLIWWHGETEREKGPVGLGRDQRLNRRDWEEWPRRALVKTPPWLETSEITKKMSPDRTWERDWRCVLQSWLSALEDVSCSLVTSTDCRLCKQHMKEVLKVEPMWKISSKWSWNCHLCFFTDVDLGSPALI